MSDRLEQCKEVVEVMKRKETNMGMVEDNLGQVVNNLEEAWGNLVEEYFNVPALQVNCPNPKPLKTHLHTEDTPSRYLHHHHPHCQHHHNLWYCVQGRRRRHHPPHQPAQLATGSTTALQTTPINEMLSFYFSKFCLSKFETRTRILFSKSQSSRWEWDFLLISQGSRRNRDIFVQTLMFREGNEIWKLFSQGWAKKMNLILRDREFSLCSAPSPSP